MAAEVPYKYAGEGPVGDIAPETILPRQDIRATPEAFGAAKGQALQQAGKTAEHLGIEALNLSNFYGQAATDDGANKLQEALDKLKYGDPNVLGEEGQPDTGFMGKRGGDAMHGYKPTLDQAEETLNSIRDSLPIGRAQQEFDRVSRGMMGDFRARVGSHYEQQGKEWAAGVNKATQATSLTDIAREPDNDATFNRALGDALVASDKNVHLAGGGEEERTAASNAIRAAAWKTRVESIGVDEPQRARQLAEAHKADLGLHYDEVANSLRARAEQQEGSTVAKQIHESARAKNFSTNPQNPIFTQAANAIPGGFSPGGMARLITIESGGKAEAGKGSSHEGYVQASNDYWRAFGAGGNKFDLADSAYAVARSSAHDRPIVAKALGRDPTDAELYLAHQQGAAGAAALFQHPNLPAVVALSQAYGGNLAAARAAIKNNRGDPDAPARDFTGFWIAKFNNMPTSSPFFAQSAATQARALQYPARMPEEAAPLAETPQPGPPPQLTEVPNHYEAVRADAYQQILDHPFSSDGARDAALAEYHKLHAAQQIADAETERARKEANNAAENDLLDLIHSGKASEAIGVLSNRSDPRLTDARSREWLWSIAMGDSSNSAVKDKVRYGDGFEPALQRLTLPPDDPAYLRDPSELVGMYARREITQGGYERLHELTTRAKKDGNGPVYADVLHNKIAYVRDQLKLEEDLGIPGVAPTVNRKGLDIYRNTVLPAFNLGLKQAEAEGPKAVEKFLDKDNLDKMIAPYKREAASGMANAKQRALQAVRANATPAQLAQEKGFLVAPKGVPQEQWDMLIAKPPENNDGLQYTPERWGAAIKRLDENRMTPEFIQGFREKFPGQDPLKLLQQVDDLRAGKAPKPKEPAGPEAPAIEAAPGWAPPQELQERAAREASAKADHDRLPPWQTSGLAPWEAR